MAESRLPEPVAPAAETGRARILVADDEPELRTVLEEILMASGYDVVGASDGAEALGALESGRFDMVVSDIAMPGMTGLQLLRAVRERDLDTPVVLMTGSPTMESAVRALEDGALKYLVKPFRHQELLDSVERALRLGRMARLKREALMLLGIDGRQVGDRAGLEATFGRALSTLQMAYQPIVHASGSPFGFEALLRSNEPALPNPWAVLDAAERLGRVAELGRAIRRKVAARLAGAPGEVIFVNLHAGDLLDPDLSSAGSALSQ